MYAWGNKRTVPGKVGVITPDRGGAPIACMRDAGKLNPAVKALMKRTYALIAMIIFLYAPLAGGEDMEKATLAGGCFWCMEAPFEELDGVEEVVSGYTGGHVEDPSYDEVCSGRTGHFEAVQITYDPSRISYSDILDVFWRQIDPTDPDGQFADRGPQYRTAIFYHDNAQKKAAEESRDRLGKSGAFASPVITPILEASRFYRAEDHHQDYYRTCPLKYKAYRAGSGRESFLQKMREKELRSKLTPVQYDVTQQCGTEPPFNNEYWDNKKEGIYVDIVSGEPLFVSTDKFESGTGWPSFTRPIDPGSLVEKEDKSLRIPRTEVRSGKSDSHLGHVFNDGPSPTGLRYCVNSAALRFVPREKLEEEGYGGYERLFEKKR
jgi:peptide methionine sulfoxide reductase msrA/msrB